MKFFLLSREATSKNEYGLPLIRNTVLMSIETGFRDEIRVTNRRAFLRSTNLSNEDLMKHVTELASNQAKRQSKLRTDHQKFTRVSGMKTVTELVYAKPSSMKKFPTKPEVTHRD